MAAQVLRFKTMCCLRITTPSSVLEQTIENTDSGENLEIRLEIGDSITLNDLADNTLTLANNVSLVLQTRNDMDQGDSATGGISFQDINDRIIASGSGSLTLQAGTGGGTPTMTLGGLTTAAGDINVILPNDLTVNRSIQAGAGNINLTTTGAGSDLTVSSGNQWCFLFRRNDNIDRRRQPDSGKR